ncbi:hypothetical protein V8C86DRAFT_3147056 [Haematococcus lacustris]
MAPMRPRAQRHCRGWRHREMPAQSIAPDAEPASSVSARQHAMRLSTGALALNDGNVCSASIKSSPRDRAGAQQRPAGALLAVGQRSATPPQGPGRDLAKWDSATGTAAAPTQLRSQDLHPSRSFARPTTSHHQPASSPSPDLPPGLAPGPTASRPFPPATARPGSTSRTPSTPQTVPVAQGYQGVLWPVANCPETADFLAAQPCPPGQRYYVNQQGAVVMACAKRVCSHVNQKLAHGAGLGGLTQELQPIMDLMPKLHVDEGINPFTRRPPPSTPTATLMHGNQPSTPGSAKPPSRQPPAEALSPELLAQFKRCPEEVHLAAYEALHISTREGAEAAALLYAQHMESLPQGTYYALLPAQAAAVATLAAGLRAVRLTRAPTRTHSSVRAALGRTGTGLFRSSGVQAQLHGASPTPTSCWAAAIWIDSHMLALAR